MELVPRSGLGRKGSEESGGSWFLECQQTNKPPLPGCGFLGDTNDSECWGRLTPPASQGPPKPRREAAGLKQAALRVLVPPHRAEGLGSGL